MNRYLTGKPSAIDVNLRLENFYIAEVIDNNDEYSGNRIKCRIKGIDDSYADDDLPYAFPLMPKFLYNVPLIGETVLVMLSKENEKTSGRFFIGPIISQPTKISNDQHFFSSQSLLDSGAIVSPDTSPNKIPDSKGIYPNPLDVSLIGRKNTDIIQKDNEIQIRSGISKNTDKTKFNSKNIGYVQLKMNISGNTEPASFATIAADNIFLLSHKGDKQLFITDPEELSAKRLNDLIAKAHNLPYGDTLIEFIKIFLEVMSSHVHPYAGLPPCNDVLMQKLLTYDLDSLISKNIKIN